MMKKWLRWPAAAASLVVIGVLLRDRLPSLADVSAALRVADPAWLLVAVLAEAISISQFARLQRRVLIGYGVTIPQRRSLALAYSRSAIAITVPAGSAVSAAYAFRQFRADGASRAVATAVMLLSGLISISGLVLLYVTGAAATGAERLAGAWRAHPGLVEGALALLVMVTVLVAVLAWPARDARPRRSWTSRLSPRLAAMLRPVADAIASSRTVAPRHWVIALGAATVNWLFDLLCLAAGARAFHLTISLTTIAAVYLTVQVVRQIPLTPGGIGVVEVSLLAGLISAGAADGPATATVLVYRLLSCWLIIPVGLLCGLLLRRPVRSGSSIPALPTRSRPEKRPAPQPVSLGYR
jgi:putative heme transporter